MSSPNPSQGPHTRISYNPPGDLPLPLDRYPVVLFPCSASPLLLPREGRSDSYPYLRDTLLGGLSRLEGEREGVIVRSGCHLPVLGRSIPYGIMAAVCCEKEGLYIDVEIDAPYDGISRICTHCTDDDEDSLRDAYFREMGWVVVRFSEHQVHRNCPSCVSIIEAIVDLCLGGGSQGTGKNLLSAIGLLPSAPKWNTFTASEMEKGMAREQYLSCQIFPPRQRTVRVICKDGEAELYPGGAPLGCDYQPCEGEGAPLVERNLPPQEIYQAPPVQYPAPASVGDPLSGRIESTLLFDEVSHTYRSSLPGAGPSAHMISVTTLISKFFPPFDEEAYIRHKVGEGTMTEEQARETLALFSAQGTYMHRQIELFLKGLPCDTSSREMGHFLKFYEDSIKKRELLFDSAEYPIQLPESDIAGTVDALFRRPDGQYVMVDWKRSSHLIVDGYPKKYGFGSGLGPLSHLDNSSYYHYELQQSFYRYILEKCYSIKISSMILAVLHPSYDRPYSIRLQDYRLREVMDIIEAWESRC